jgi:tetratricopeptide (TPR) repeat protein
MLRRITSILSIITVFAAFAGCPQSALADSQEPNLEATFDAIIVQIDAGQYEAADAASQQMTVDFADANDLPHYLWQIANRLEKHKAYAYSKIAVQRVIDNFPNDHRAGFSRLYLARQHVFELIEAGDVNDANIAAIKIIQDYQGNSQLSRRLYEIAQQLAEHGGRPFAEALHARIAADFPKDKYGRRSAVQAAKLHIYDLLDANDFTDADATVAKMKTDFAGYEILTDQLDSVAEGYARAGDAVTASALCRQIVDSNSAAIKVRASAAARMDKYDLFRAIEAGDSNLIQTMIRRAGAGLSSDGGLDQYLTVLAGACYSQGRWAKIDGDMDVSLRFIGAAVSLWTRVFTECPDSPLAPHACFAAGAQSAKELGDYPRAVQDLQKLVDNWPGYEYAYWAQFKIADDLEIMVQNGSLTPGQAKSGITAALQAVITNYPKCAWVSSARSLLDYYSVHEPGTRISPQ